MTGTHRRRLLGAGTMLLVIALINGFLIDSLALPRLALSAHLVGLVGASFLIGLSASWPTLALSPRASAVGAATAIYGFAGAWLVYFSAAATGAGGSFPMAGMDARGGALVEEVLRVGLLTVAIALFSLCGVVLTGLRKARHT